MRRYSDGGALTAPWIAVVAVVALAEGVFTARRPQFGRVMTPVVGVVRDGRLLLDCLTLTDEEAERAAAAVATARG